MKITKHQLKELIRQSLNELKFKDQKAFKKYDKQHNLKADTEVEIGGKKTTVGQAIDVGGPSHSNVDKEKSKPKTSKIKSNPFADKDDSDDKDNEKMSDTEKEMDTAARYANVKMDRGEAQDMIDKGEVTPDNMQDVFNKVKSYADWMGYEDEIEDLEQDLPDMIEDGDVEFFIDQVKELGLLDPDKREKETGDYLDQMDDEDEDDVGGPAHPNVKKKREVKESKKRRFTVKEVRMWMKKLEENRYKKVYNSDARRVAWMVNNEGVDLQEMPVSMRKKWTKAQYGRERYLAKEFKKSQKQKMTESNIRNLVRNKIIIKLNEAKMVQLQIPIRDKLKVNKILKLSKGKMGKHYDFGVGRPGTFILELDKKFENKVLELMIKNKVQVKEV